MSMSKSLQPKNKFCAIIKEATSKTEIPKDFYKLVVVIGSKENCFSVNYANYFSCLIKRLNEYYSFNFYYNFIKKNNGRRKRSPLFTVKRRCAMNECSVNITVQRQINLSWELNNSLTVFIQSDASYLVDGAQVQIIIHDEKKKMQSKFTSYSRFELSTLYRKKNCWSWKSIIC